MVFSSIIFLFLFLPIVLGVYHILFLPVTLGYRPTFFRQASNVFLLFASLIFYFWGEQWLVWIVIASTFIDYFCGLLIADGFNRREIQPLEHNTKRTTKQRVGLALSILSNLAFLGFFKYYNFGIASFNSIAPSGMQFVDVAEIALPLGISFYTFQSMSYTIDVYRGDTKATRNIANFACYVTMFPQLVAGPIVRYRDVAEQLVSRTVSRVQFASGVQRFILGLAKKVLVANTMAVAADAIFASDPTTLSARVAWLGAIAYALQIYYDFSGYTDMAIGLGRMFGFEFLENFNYPYVARSVQGFWRRWHISLSTWFRDYVYIPLGGNRSKKIRTYLNLVAVFFLCGLWHGASWTFVVWGLYHGVFLTIERMGLADFLDKRNKFIAHIYTLLVVLGGWVIFRAETFEHATGFFSSMLGIATSGDVGTHGFLTRKFLLGIVFAVVFATPLLPRIAAWKGNLYKHCKAKTAISIEFIRISVLVFLFLLCAMSLASGTHNPFIYFRF